MQGSNLARDVSLVLSGIFIVQSVVFMAVPSLCWIPECPFLRTLIHGNVFHAFGNSVLLLAFTFGFGMDMRRMIASALLGTFVLLVFDKAIGFSASLFAYVGMMVGYGQMKWKYALRFLAITNIPLLIFSPMSSVIHISAYVIGFLSLTIYKCFRTN